MYFRYFHTALRLRSAAGGSGRSEIEVVSLNYGLLSDYSVLCLRRWELNKGEKKEKYLKVVDCQFSSYKKNPRTVARREAGHCTNTRMGLEGFSSC